MQKHFAVLLAGLALLVAGCGDDTSTEAEGQGEQSGAAAEVEEPAKEQEPTESEQAAGSMQITIKNFAYEPADAKAKVGDEVTWINEDGAPHDADSTKGPELKTKILNKGQSDSVTLEEAGTIEYICSVHPQMKATLTVTE